ncbi:SusC/RagA family TonB-linked outer membrane protein [Hymenobacter sp. HMF4947]|uniref:SusC/RagA family TonB-linked outer membrane protein n=1 Tax=Hymenobacter ginkgonis TaxID=2682976 RepID=A0A7K1TJX7_9BACT|nr:TonB-dependent receptor [Hymenobacter ginkgonis]MVN78636.1 SusC/RagA family TonB-linked outer membrane protein [Hymenobacter ginkgonis]
MKNLHFLTWVLLALALLPAALFAQQAPITGVVTDAASQEALIGVTVLVKGTSINAQTGVDGRYSIAAPADAVLSFNYVGYAQQEIPVAGKTAVNVALASTTKLNEVVVVGYGTQKRRDLTGAVARIEGDEIVNQPVQTPTQALQGKLAGVQIISDGTPNSQPTVRIRGTGTLLAGANPLYVVDGVQTTDIRNLSNADIASIDVLKDASAAAIYGVRGANGVIIVTTKKGAVGKPTLSYSGTYGFKEAAHLVEMANADQYKSYITDTSPTTTFPTYPGFSGTTNWYKEILKRGTFQNHNLAVSGATDNVRYYFSGNLLQDDGLLVDNRFSRLTVRSNTSFSLSDKVTISSQASYSHANTRDVNIGSAYLDAYRAAPIIPARQGDLFGNTAAYGNVGNPLVDIGKNYNQSSENRLQGNIGVDVRPVEWLTLRSAINVDLNANTRTIYNYQFNNDASTFIIAGGNQFNTTSNLSVMQSNSYRYLWENTATFHKVFGENHDLTVLAGTTTEEGQYTPLYGYRRSVSADPNQWYLNTGDPNTSVVNPYDPNNPDANMLPSKDRRFSVLGRINYSYAGRYLLTANLRYDASSKFASDRRKGVFPSLGLGWVVSDEEFLKDVRGLSFLKLRGSFGRLGNDQIPTNSFVTTADINIPYVINGQPVLGAVISQIKDGQVHWETTTEYDAALEFGFLDNHLTGEVTYYNKRTSSALIPINIPGILGDPDNQLITNAADITNRGVEAALNWRSTIVDNFTYNFGVNATFNQNRIANLNGGQALFAGGNLQTRSDNGQAAGSFYLLNAIGVYQTQDEINSGPKSTFAPKVGDLKYADTNGDGVIDLNDRSYYGSYQPPIYFGINGGINVHNFDLSFVFSGNLKNKVYNAKKQNRYAGTDNVEASFASSRWTAANPSTTNPSTLASSLPNSTYFLESGAYLRLTNVILGYTFPVSSLEKAHLATLRVFLSGQNLFTATKYTGFTPELPGGPLDSGIEAQTYPTSRTLTVGLTANFK